MAIRKVSDEYRHNRNVGDRRVRALEDDVNSIKKVLPGMTVLGVDVEVEDELMKISVIKPKGTETEEATEETTEET